MGNWISTKDSLPKHNQYVLCYHTRGTWEDNDSNGEHNCIVLKFKMGRTTEECEKIGIYRSEDQQGNNKVPYCWEEFGPDSFFGQDISHWMPIKAPKE